MSQNDFYELLRLRKWREPFQPFFVELTTGQRFLVDEPRRLVFVPSFALFDTQSDDSYEFRPSDVSRIVDVTPSVIG